MDSIFYIFAKLFWLIFSPDGLLVALLIAATLMLWSKWLKFGRGLLTFLSLISLMVWLLPLHEWLIYPLESTFAPTNPPGLVDGIIVLGGSGDMRKSSQWGQLEVSRSAERYIAFASLAHRYPAAKLVFSGGAGSMSQQAFKEADLIKQFLMGLGVTTDRLILERESRNTFENATLSKKLIQPQPEEKWLIITSAAHMPRAVGTFCKLGWPVIPYPVDHETNPEYLWRVEPMFGQHLSLLSNAVKEWIGLIVYNATHKTTALLPSGCDLADGER